MFRQLTPDIHLSQVQDKFLKNATLVIQARSDVRDSSRTSPLTPA